MLSAEVANAPTDGVIAPRAFERSLDSLKQDIGFVSGRAVLVVVAAERANQRVAFLFAAPVTLGCVGCIEPVGEMCHEMPDIVKELAGRGLSSDSRTANRHLVGVAAERSGELEA